MDDDQKKVQAELLLLARNNRNDINSIKEMMLSNNIVIFIMEIAIIFVELYK